MRKKHLIKYIQKAIDNWLETGSSNDFYPLLTHMKDLWTEWAKEENDYRSGSDTYGYRDVDDYGDTEYVYRQMHYISDRWKCAFRLKWIIDGVERGDI